MTDNKRGAGILMHISSLPSPFGIGDLGPEAIRFTDFLHKSGQKYWQLLPLNPTEQGQGHSPYSSISSRAGNTLLISPELLAKDDLLSTEELNQYFLPHEGKTDFTEAARVKAAIFDRAWKNFQQKKGTQLYKDFEKFCKKEAYWLDDFALYMVLKQDNGNKPWFEWPEKFKLRDAKTLKTLLADSADAAEKIKWLQFIFSKQWHELKTYVNNKNIKFFGDLPFYTSYDSVDVWANRNLFSIDEEGNTIGMAGVPPDAFSEDGQLWGMPVFRWDVLKKNNYSWWIERFKKNMELFDLLPIIGKYLQMRKQLKMANGNGGQEQIFLMQSKNHWENYLLLLKIWAKLTTRFTNCGTHLIFPE
jgi:4-alpha-glucanotransferase